VIIDIDRIRMNSSKELPDYSQPDEFITAPLLVLVPPKGNVNSLEGFATSLYARFEKLSLTVRELEGGRQGGGGNLERYLLERDMIREVLAWLAITPEETP
jgi:hypothetical protein